MPCPSRASAELVQRNLAYLGATGVNMRRKLNDVARSLLRRPDRTKDRGVLRVGGIDTIALREIEPPHDPDALDRRAWTRAISGLPAASTSAM